MDIEDLAKCGTKTCSAVPAFMFLWGVTDTSSHHFRRYRLPELTHRMKEAGLTIQYAGYFNTFLFAPIAAVRLAVRFLHLPMKSEHQAVGGIANTMCYYIFAFESRFIPLVRFPFGVSALALATK